ncbi:hypothetical protein HHI36_001942, partial [Cryptolaemus montrouzieri]
MAASEVSTDRELLALELNQLVKKSLIDIILTKTVPKEVTNDLLKKYLGNLFSFSENESVFADAASEPIEENSGKEDAVRDRSSIKFVERDQRASYSSLIDTDAKRQFPKKPSNLHKVNNNNQETADLLK